MVRWVLDLVDVIWLGFFGAWFVVFVAEQILYARGRPGSGLGPPGDGGWCFVKGGAADLAGLDDRRGRWTVRDQLRIEIRSPLVWAIWAMVLGNGVAGVALADTGALWAGTLFAIVYGWMLWNHLKLVNRARVCELPVLTLRGPTFFRGGDCHGPRSGDGQEIFGGGTVARESVAHGSPRRPRDHGGR